MRTGLTVIHELDGIKFYGEIAEVDLIPVKLDHVDQALLNSVPMSAPVADVMLVLEMLFRRIGEHQKRTPHDAG